MKNLTLAAAPLLSLKARMSGTPADLYANDSTPVATQKVAYAAPASISRSTVDRTNPSANRFGDASPANQQ